MRALKGKVLNDGCAAFRAGHNMVDVKDRDLSNLQDATIAASPAITCEDGESN